MSEKKTSGQIAYEAFRAAFLPPSVLPISWEDTRLDTRVAWEAAADAAISHVDRATIVGGPVEMRDYDYITLAQPHRVELGAHSGDPGSELPAGTRLYMVTPEKGAIGLRYETGAACKAGDWPHLRELAERGAP